MLGDQAFALRELVKRNSEESIPNQTGYIVVTGGCAGVGSSSIASAIAAINADQQHKTLLVDVAPNAGASEHLGNAGTVALPDVLNDMNQAPAAIGRGPGQAFFLPTHPVPQDVSAEQVQEIAESVPATVAQLNAGFDTVIVDCGNSSRARWKSLWDGAAHVLIVTSESDESIMGAYSTVKTHTPTQCADIRILINGVANRAAAEQVWGRIASAAQRFLGIRLGFAGYLPQAVGGSANDALQPALEEDATARLCLRRVLSDLDLYQNDCAESSAPHT